MFILVKWTEFRSYVYKLFSIIRIFLFFFCHSSSIHGYILQEISSYFYTSRLDLILLHFLFPSWSNCRLVLSKGVFFILGLRTIYAIAHANFFCCRLLRTNYRFYSCIVAIKHCVCELRHYCSILCKLGRYRFITSRIWPCNKHYTGYEQEFILGTKLYTICWQHECVCCSTSALLNVRPQMQVLEIKVYKLYLLSVFWSIEQFKESKHICLT